MLITIDEFRHRVDNDRATLVSDLQELTGRYGSDEAAAWNYSLLSLSQVTRVPSFGPLHLFFGRRGHLSLEYQLPASSSWCDVVLLGAHNQAPAAVFLELKDWITRGDQPGRYEGLIERQGEQRLHPSDQVRGYTEYCRQFHSAVADHKADVHGCVLFTRDRWTEGYAAAPNAALAGRYPLFTMAPIDVEDRFPAYFRSRLTEPDEEFARAFEAGQYRQDRGFIRQIALQILKPESKVFELLDEQRVAFAVCRGIVEDSFLRPDSKTLSKKVVIIKGPPGAGKSVIAARLWASLVKSSGLPEGDAVFVTTSMSQNSNWGDLFSRASGIESARGVIRKASGFSPLTTQALGALRKKHGGDFLASDQGWRENLSTLIALGVPFRDGSRNNQNLVSIVDEAHSLINPERPEGRGQYGFATALGPQAYHIIRSSALTIFLLDPLQAFRRRENTTVEDIKAWSRELGAGDPEEISLEGAQFRCAGSADYVEWIESVLKGASAADNRVIAAKWVRGLEPVGAGGVTEPAPGYLPRVAEPLASYTTGGVENLHRVTVPGMDFRIFDNPEDWEDQLRRQIEAGNSVRLLSTYSRKWKTKGRANPHELPPHLMDFHEPYEVNGRSRHWSRVWNYIPSPGSDYTWYVMGHPRGLVAKDPLCEVGCPYAVRGFDYDYVGILWLDDLVWRGSRWKVNPDVIEESGFEGLTNEARREAKMAQGGQATLELSGRAAQAYRILFTRALKGAYVWIPDAETRGHMLASLR